MKYFFIVGERSGDLHASNLAKELKRLNYEAEMVGFGGDQMEEQGVKILRHYKDYSFMGFLEVVRNLDTIRRTLKACKKAMLEEKPDVVVLVDFPGFNLRMAGYAKKLGIKVCYYISPKIWAWKEGRIKKIKAFVDKMLVILPFEISFYKKHNFSVTYVGNPLMDTVRQYNHQEIETGGRTTIGVLPGSRKQELRAASSVVVEMARLRPAYRFLVAGVDNLPDHLYADMRALPNVEVIYNRTYDILKYSNAALVTSGTATLEACLLSAPQVVCYRTSPISYAIGKRLVKVKFISLVNLIADREVVRELIQGDFNASAVLEELERILKDHEYCATILDDYLKIKEKIGFEPASKRAAHAVNEWLEEVS